MKHRITSIANAIKYFEAGMTITEKEVNGETYTQYRPPRGFDRMDVTMSSGITFNYDQRFWRNYVRILQDKEVVRIKLTYHD